jgi:hypothetical protein
MVPDRDRSVLIRRGRTAIIVVARPWKAFASTFGRAARDDLPTH